MAGEQSPQLPRTTLMDILCGAGGISSPRGGEADDGNTEATSNGGGTCFSSFTQGCTEQPKLAAGQ